MSASVTHSTPAAAEGGMNVDADGGSVATDVLDSDGKYLVSVEAGNDLGEAYSGQCLIDSGAISKQKTIESDGTTPGVSIQFSVAAGVVTFSGYGSTNDDATIQWVRIG